MAVRKERARRSGSAGRANTIHRVVVLLNAGAGSTSEAEDLESQICHLFESGGVRPDIRRMDGEQVTAITKQAVAEGDVIIAGGGDGTISAVAAEVAGTGKTLGVLPLGTLNHFAKDLGIPTDLEGAIQTIIEGQVATIDVGQVNQRVFINNSGLGIYPHVVQRRVTEQKRAGIGKWPAFAWALLNVFRRFPFLDLRIEVNGTTLRRRTAFLLVGNNEYEMTGFQIGARQRLDSGKLALYMAHRAGRWGLFRVGVRAFLGHLNQEKDFEAYLVEEAFIDSHRHSILVTTDGEVQRFETPLHYLSRPAALRVIVPRTRTA
jgi:diacylglycerol kinase family enzyme